MSEAREEKLVPESTVASPKATPGSEPAAHLLPFYQVQQRAQDR